MAPIKKIIVIGGGPGGLYFALLTKKARPDWHIEVHEQNHANDTFGFGVVFSDDTLDEFLDRDPQSYNAIVNSFSYWDDVVVRVKGQSIRCAGNGFAGCSRLTLLKILHERCREVGVKLHFESMVDAASITDQFPNASIIVAADGINSQIREQYKKSFLPKVTMQRNKFVWMGSTRQLDAFTYFFKETAYGIVIAHTYQHEPGMSTWVFEMSEECWQSLSLDGKSEKQSANILEAIFDEELAGHKLITNRSLWRNFPRIFCDSWSHENVVLLGDAKASAHFSIGSGTKLAMECAISLSDATCAHLDEGYAAVFKQYDSDRRVPVQITQHNADVSLDWFEHVERSWDMSPTQFAMVVMSRAKSITYDNLLLRDEQFVDRVETDFYQRLFEETGVDCRKTRPTPMFTPFQLRNLQLSNRVVVSPMAQYSAVDGVPTDWHLVHYGSRAMGGAGLIYTEMTCPSAEARITTGCTGIWNNEQEQAWAKIVDFVHTNSASKICMQLGHAGRKGSTQVGWEEMDHPLNDENWPLISASPIPYIEGTSQIPTEMNSDQMEEVCESFVQAAIRADRAGFDMLELHCAHGYLLASFISPLTNKRTDEYGGSVEGRAKFPLEVFTAVRSVWDADKPIAIRISACDWHDHGITEEEVIQTARLFSAAGCDLIDVSTGQTVHEQEPIYGRMYQAPFAEAIRNLSGIATMAVGNITEPAQVNTIIACRRADLVALARPHLWHPNFTQHAAAWYGVDSIHCPKQYLSGHDQIFRTQQAARAKLVELQVQAKPKSHQPANDESDA